MISRSTITNGPRLVEEFPAREESRKPLIGYFKSNFVTDKCMSSKTRTFNLKEPRL
jgi:hypothetical protein